MIIMLVVVVVFFGAVFGYEVIRSRAASAKRQQKPPPSTVSATKAEYQQWQPQISAVGSLRAVQGVQVTTQIAGQVQQVLFRSGDTAKSGQPLVQLSAEPDIASLHSLQAQAEQASVVYERDKKQFAIQAVSQATLDADAADLKSKQALAAQQQALVAEKTVSAPFAGRLGISSVNPGQYLNPGDAVVTLQSLDPIYADFYLAQQDLSRVSAGQKLSLEADAYAGRSFDGEITAVNPIVDTATRNFQVEATLPNPKEELLPGMFVTVTVQVGPAQRNLTLPKTAVAYNSYGETVFIVTLSGQNDPNGKPAGTVKQVFVTTGATRGDQVAISEGVKEGDLVVTSGQLKLRNGAEVVIDNSVQPSNEAAPRPVEQ
jgi:membrane fusion protein (multidrug efflux system)